MLERPTFTGFSPAEALCKLLQLRDVWIPLSGFHEMHGTEWSAEDLAVVASEMGVPARAARITWQDARGIRFPSLAQASDGRWIVLHRRDGASLLVEDRSGMWRARAETLSGPTSGWVLDTGVALPKGDTLGRRIRALLVSVYGPWLLQAVAATVLLQTLTVIGPLLTVQVMNSVITNSASHLLRLLVCGLVIAGLFQALVAWIRGRILHFIITQLDVAVRRGLLEHTLGLPFLSLQARSTGELLQAFGGLALAREVFAESVVGAMLDGLVAVVTLPVMFALAPALAVVVLGACGLSAGVAVVGARLQAAKQSAEVAAQARERGYLAELISNVFSIKSVGAEEHALAHWSRQFRNELECGLARQRVSAVVEPVGDFLRNGLTSGLLMWGGLSALRGDISMGVLLGFVQLASVFMTVVNGLSGALVSGIVLKPQLQQAQDLLGLASGAATRRARRQAQPAALAMDDVWFRYAPDQPWVLRGHTLNVDAGEKRILSGSSGSGKSTILRIAAGLLPVERGVVTIGGTPAHSARHRILYLPQFVTLFDGTILTNLKQLSGGAPNGRLFEAADRTGLAAFVASMPMAYDTIIPRGGRTLSGGQRQLIALTAALASDRDVLLLDEALANIDPFSMAELLRSIEETDRTVVMVHHSAM